MTSKEATERRIKLERAGWRVRSGKFYIPENLIKTKTFSTDEAEKIQEIFGEGYSNNEEHY